MQYVDKSKTGFNRRLNNHQKDSKKKDAILACTHFKNLNHIFHRDAKFILSKQITNKYNTIEKIRFILKKRENSWTLNHCSVYSDDLNQELNDVPYNLSEKSDVRYF